MSDTTLNQISRVTVPDENGAEQTYEIDAMYLGGETLEDIKKRIAGAVDYLGTVDSESALNALAPKNVGDFARVSQSFEIKEGDVVVASYHAGDLLICETVTVDGETVTSATWSQIHGEEGDITEIIAQNGLTGGGSVGKVTIEHATKANGLTDLNASGNNTRRYVNKLVFDNYGHLTDYAVQEETGTNADYNEYNSESPAFIKNRPFCTEYKRIEIPDSSELVYLGPDIISEDLYASTNVGIRRILGSTEISQIRTLDSFSKELVIENEIEVGKSFTYRLYSNSSTRRAVLYIIHTPTETYAQTGIYYQCFSSTGSTKVVFEWIDIVTGYKKLDNKYLNLEGNETFVNATETLGAAVENLGAAIEDLGDAVEEAKISTVADYEVNDEENLSYIKNRPFYSQVNEISTEGTTPNSYYYISDEIIDHQIFDIVEVLVKESVWENSAWTSTESIEKLSNFSSAVIVINNEIVGYEFQYKKLSLKIIYKGIEGFETPGIYYKWFEYVTGNGSDTYVETIEAKKIYLPKIQKKLHNSFLDLESNDYLNNALEKVLPTDNKEEGAFLRLNKDKQPIWVVLQNAEEVSF